MQLPKQFKRKQAGFIQNFIIPGIILIGVVIAGIAMLASNSGGTDTSNEKAAMVANVVVGDALRIQSAVQRALADGSLADKEGQYFHEGPASVSSGDEYDLYDQLVLGKYLTALPSLPSGLSGAVDGHYYIKYDAVYYQGAEAKVTPFVSLTIGATDRANAAFDLSVCQRINNKVSGTPTNTAPPTFTWNTDAFPATEGCYLVDGTQYFYLKRI